MTAGNQGNQAIQPGEMFLGGVIDPVSGKRMQRDIIYEARNLTNLL